MVLHLCLAPPTRTFVVYLLLLSKRLHNSVARRTLFLIIGFSIITTIIIITFIVTIATFIAKCRPYTWCDLVRATWCIDDAGDDDGNHDDDDADAPDGDAGDDDADDAAADFDDTATGDDVCMYV